MIRIRQIEIPVEEDTFSMLQQKCSQKLKVPVSKIQEIKINKKSIDARHKPKIIYCYEVDVTVEKEQEILKKNHSKDIISTPKKKHIWKETGTIALNKRIIIVGMGPSGLFCGYFLASHGYAVTLIDRGSKIDKRISDVETFWKTGVLDVNSNVQFGEGGAGTFSDGKLNTLIKDTDGHGRKVLEVLVECGAPKEILYEHKPHIGTDLLRQIMINIREKMEKMGCIFLYDTCLTDLIIQENRIKAIEVNGSNRIDTDVLVLALGHSARDTFSMLYQKKLEMKSKPFAIGLRIQHPQKMINHSQYGRDDLPPASYKLTYKAKNNHGVYTFCMCPGGYIVNASSEKGRLAINGMSNYKRETKNANSAIVVTVSSEDYGEGVLDGIFFQQKLEEATYQLGKGKIPIQLWKDFKNNTCSKEFGEVEPIMKGEYVFGNLREIIPNFMSDALIEAIEDFDHKIKGFAREDAILAGIESRTSSPIRITRDEEFVSNIDGIYPIGEGAGYAGGITSSAIDGIKCSMYITSKYAKMKKNN